MLSQRDIPFNVYAASSSMLIIAGMLNALHPPCSTSHTVTSVSERGLIGFCCTMAVASTASRTGRYCGIRVAYIVRTVPFAFTNTTLHTERCSRGAISSRVVGSGLLILTSIVYFSPMSRGILRFFRRNLSDTQPPSSFGSDGSPSCHSPSRSPPKLFGSIFGGNILLMLSLINLSILSLCFW